MEIKYLIFQLALSASFEYLHYLYTAIFFSFSERYVAGTAIHTAIISCFLFFRFSILTSKIGPIAKRVKNWKQLTEQDGGIDSDILRIV